jgi:hypothetical protein
MVGGSFNGGCENTIESPNLSANQEAGFDSSWQG